MGEGAERKTLEATAREMGLDNVLFHDFVAHDQVPAYLAALDLFIVHLRPDPVFETVIPSKIFESMALGVPILMAVAGEGATIVKETGAGTCLPPGDPSAMAEEVIRLSSEEGELRRMGRCGLQAVSQGYSRAASAKALLASLSAAVVAFDGGSEE